MLVSKKRGAFLPPFNLDVSWLPREQVGDGRLLDHAIKVVEGDLVVLGVPALLDRVPDVDDVLLDEGGENAPSDVHGNAGDVLGEGEVVAVAVCRLQQFGKHLCLQRGEGGGRGGGGDVFHRRVVDHIFSVWSSKIDVSKKYFFLVTFFN